MVFFAENIFAEEPPIDVVFLLNTSDEMNFADQERAAINAITQFVRAVGVGETRVGVVTSTRQIPLRQPENDYVISGLTAAIATIEYAGGESFNAAFSAAANMAATQNSFIIHITHENGQTENSTAAGIPVNAVFVNSGLNAEELSGRFHRILNTHRANIAAADTPPEPTPEPVPPPPPVIPQEEPIPREEEIPPQEDTEEPEDIHEEISEEIIEEIPEEILAEENVEIEYEEIPPEEIPDEEVKEEHEEPSEEESPEEEPELEEPTYTLLFSMAFISLIAAAFSVFRFMKVVI